MKAQGQLVSSWLLSATSHLKRAFVLLFYYPWAAAANFCCKGTNTDCPKEIGKKQDHNLSTSLYPLTASGSLQPEAPAITLTSSNSLSPTPSSWLVSLSWQQPKHRSNSFWKPCASHTCYSWPSSKIQFALVSFPFPQFHSHFTLDCFPLNQP